MAPAQNDPERADELAASMNRWRGYLEAGVARMRASGLLQSEADPRSLALSIFAALQGGLLLTQTLQSLEPLDAALTGALTVLRAAAIP
jgi:hypothetical protein